MASKSEMTPINTFLAAHWGKKNFRNPKITGNLENFELKMAEHLNIKLPLIFESILVSSVDFLFCII
jgi:hypothetical protein